MVGINRVGKIIFGIILMSLVIVSCSTIKRLNVNYRLPPTTEAMEGRKVSLGFIDERTEKAVIGSGAKKDFQNFSENFTLSLSRGTNPPTPVGVFEIQSLFREAFKRKFENEGVEVLPKEAGSDVEVVIALEEFLLDQVGGKWKFNMAYEARLLRDGKMLTKQMISGEAERLKLIGTGDADKLVGETFTDMVNQLDVGRLFEQAR